MLQKEKATEQRVPSSKIQFTEKHELHFEKSVKGVLSGEGQHMMLHTMIDIFVFSKLKTMNPFNDNKPVCYSESVDCKYIQ